MRYWGNGMGGWGMILMTFSGLLFWGLIITGIVLLVRYMGRGGHPGSAATQTPTQTPAPQQALADRFARGEIDEDEYTRRLQVQDGTAPAKWPGS